MTRIFALCLLLAGCGDTVLAPPGLLFGDVDGSGEITVIDADLIYAVTTGSAVVPIALIQACGDVDGDHVVTVLDAYHVYAYLQGVTPCGRVGKPCRR